jgi:hypothetical protein
MRDRLIELMRDFCEYTHCLGKNDLSICQNQCSRVSKLADHLLAEGVIVPPYKPLPLIDEGDRVLCPICESDLMGCYLGYEESPSVVTCYGCGAWIDSTKAVDREEAEKALAERSKE